MKSMNLGSLLVLAALLTLIGVNPQHLQAQTGPYMMVFLTLDPNRPVLPQEIIDSLQASHLENIQRLANEGKLLIVGRFESGGGIFVMSTGTKDSADLWLSTDPALRSKRWIVETYPYVPRIGGICVVAVKYEMETYSFVRFEWKDKNAENRMMSLFNRKSIVGAGLLQGSGSVLVIRGDVDEKALTLDRVVQEQKIAVAVRKLNIAKGSFCEDR